MNLLVRTVGVLIGVIWISTQAPILAQDISRPSAEDLAAYLLGSEQPARGFVVTDEVVNQLAAAGLTPERFELAGASYIGDEPRDGWSNVAVEFREMTGRRLLVIMRAQIIRIEGRQVFADAAVYFNSTEFPETRLRIVPSATFDGNAAPADTHARVIELLGRVRREAIPSEQFQADPDIDNYQLILVFIDRISPDASIELRASLEAGSDLYRNLSFDRLEQTGWPIIVVDQLPAGARFLEVYYAPGTERPVEQRSSRRIATYEIRP